MTQSGIEVGERILSWSLKLLGIILFIAPFIAALAMHNWDIQAAVLPSQAEMGEIQDSVQEILGKGFSENTLSVGSPTYVDTTIRIPVQFASPFNIPVKIKDFSGSVTDMGAVVGHVWMEETEVEIPPNETVNFMLVGTYTGGVPANPQLSKANVTFEFYGVTIQVHVSGGQA